MSNYGRDPSYLEKQMERPDAALNYEGGLAYRHGAKQTLAKMAACCLMTERSFYEDTTGRILELVEEVVE